MEYSNEAIRVNGVTNGFISTNGVIPTTGVISTNGAISKNGMVKQESTTIKKSKPILIKPARDTFGGLYFLSNLDQTYPYPIEVLFSFVQNGDMKKCTQVIKESLEKSLVEYYPFAGRLTTSWDGKMHVRCTGEGVSFVEADVDYDLASLGDTTIVDPVKLRKYVHYFDNARNIMDEPLLTVQATRFKCGGIILGVRMNHVLIDGRSLAEFINSWSQLAKGVQVTLPPFLDRSILNARNPLQVHLPHPEYERSEVIISPPSPPPPLQSKTFVFSAEKLKSLKKLATCTSDSATLNPTTFELISAVLWTCRTIAYETEHEKTTKILTAVDVRPKLCDKIKMPKGYFGNGIVWSCAQSNAGKLLKSPYSYAVLKVQEALKEVTEDYVRSAIDHHEITRAQLETENTFCITKWSRLTFYDTDFGWGEPTQVAPTSVVDNLMVTLSPGKEKDQIIHVSLSLPDTVMKIFNVAIKDKFGVE